MYCLHCGTPAEPKIPQGDTRERNVCPNPDCGYIHYQNPNIICGALVTYEDKILLCKRAIEPQYGFWTLPAGFMEIGESMMEGAKRETIEEAQAIATDMKLYCLFDIPALGQMHVMYLAQLETSPDKLINGKLFDVGEESLETKLVTQAEIEKQIGWQNIAFESVSRTLRHYFTDRKVQSHNNTFDDFPIHEEIIEKNPKWDI